MSTTPDTYLSNRVLKLNVGFLLGDNIVSRTHDSTLEFPAVRVADDLYLHYIHGPLRLSRAKEGVLVQANIDTELKGTCSRCLDPINRTVHVEIEELYAYHSDADTEFRIGEDAVLDLGPLLRAEVMMASDTPALCRTDCQGLCPECGANRNHTTCTCDTDVLDPRMAVLKQLLDKDQGA